MTKILGKRVNRSAKKTEVKTTQATPEIENVQHVEKQVNDDVEKILDQFSNATKELDGKLAQSKSEEETAKILREELKRADEAEKKVEEAIKEKVEEVKQKLPNFSKYWNGVTDGWYD